MEQNFFIKILFSVVLLSIISGIFGSIFYAAFFIRTANGLIAPLFTLVGVISGALVNHFLEKSRHTKETIFGAKREVYGKILGKLRNAEVNITQEELSYINEILSEAILLSGEELREKLVKAGNSFPSEWELNYGKIKPDALKDIEMSMRKELLIE